MVEVIASHYLDAYQAAPDAEGAVEIKRKAHKMLARAGERAESLAAAGEARRYFEQAAELTTEPLEQAHLLHQAGRMAGYAGNPDAAERLLEQSIALYEAEGDNHAGARASMALARIEALTGRLDEAMDRGERALAVISTDEPSEELALLAARMAHGYWFKGDLERAAERAELALDLAEAHGFAEPLVLALRSKGAIAESRGHFEEAGALIEHALAIALDHDLVEEASIAYFILSDRCFRRDRYADALGYLDESLVFVRREGSRPGEWAVLAERTYPLYMLGRWDEAVAVTEEFTQEMIDSGGVFLSLLDAGLEIYLQRGELDRARQLLTMFSRIESSADVQERAVYLGANAALLRAEGRLAEALEEATAAMEEGKKLGPQFQAVKTALVQAVEAAFALGKRERADEILRSFEELPPVQRSPFLAAQTSRFRGRLQRDLGRYEAATSLLRELEIPFWLAVALLEHAELTGDESCRAEAREIFEQLRATPWLERAAGVGSALEAGVE